MTALMDDIPEYDFKHVSIRLVKEQSVYKTYKRLDCPEKVADTLFDFISGFDREICMVISLTTRGKPINYNIMSIGTIDSAIVSPREALKAGLLSNATSQILVHNHPGGDPTPSAEDDRVTLRMKQAGDLIGIRLIDHIIIGDDRLNYYSYCENGRIINEEIKSYDVSNEFSKVIRRKEKAK